MAAQASVRKPLPSQTSSHAGTASTRADNCKSSLLSSPDAEDAAQDILLKVITHLSSFRGESAFATWAFRIAMNHLKNYGKHMFAQHPLSFEYYGDDIVNAKIQDVPDMTQDVEKTVLAEELKLSCTNVMLQCLDPDSRCIFILGTMFRLDSRMAGEILDMTPEAYRQ
ncbi:MAG: sigma-70 family RNA polymerase sigma factor, partial [Lachnospiraceae bacterium]|nr:sigma-70 family RNA polymerase sigma factor [Lachnospiraceae bacterium]